jgi:excisionase family DNA binding protein
MDMDNPPRFFTAEEVAKALRTTGTLIRREIAAGRLHAVMVGKQWRISQSSVDAYIAQRTKDVAP